MTATPPVAAPGSRVRRCTIDADRRVVEARGDWESLLGYGSRDLLRGDLLDLVHPEDRASTSDLLAKLARGEGVLGFENRVRRADGSFLWLGWAARSAPRQRLVHLVARDISARRHAEQAIAQEIAALAQLNAELLMGRLTEPGSPASVEAAPPPAVATVPPASLGSELFDTLRRAARTSHALDESARRLARHVARLRDELAGEANEGALRRLDDIDGFVTHIQALANDVRSHLHSALGESGQSQAGDPAERESDEFAAGGGTLPDDPSLQALARPVGSPSVDRASSAAPALGPPGAATAATACVLVADDEVITRTTIRHVLTKAGYKVLEAADGPEALRLAETYVGPIHVLLTDVVMPGMQGHSLAALLSARRPEIRTLYMSSYSGKLIREHGLLAADAAFVHKPFSTPDLVAAIESVLRG